MTDTFDIVVCSLAGASAIYTGWKAFIGALRYADASRSTHAQHVAHNKKRALITAGLMAASVMALKDINPAAPIYELVKPALPYSLRL